MAASLSAAMERVAASPATYFKLVAVAALWGATWVAARVAVSEVAPLAVASWRFLLAALVLGTLLVVREGWPRWSRGQWLTLTTMGASGIFLYNVCFLYGMTMIQAGRGALVVALTPALIAASDCLLFGAPMSPGKALGIGLAAFGCLLVVTNGHPYLLIAGEVGLGEWLIIGCAAMWTIYTFLGRRGTRSLSPLAMTFGASVTGWLMLTAAALLQGSLFSLAEITWRGGNAIAFLGLFGTALAFTWYAEAVQRIGATRSAAFINLVPVSAVLLGAVLLGERLGLVVLGGGALVILGVYMTNRAGAKLAAGANLTVMACRRLPDHESHDRFPPRAVRIPACTPESFDGQGACAPNPPSHPQPFSRTRQKGDL